MPEPQTAQKFKIIGQGMFSKDYIVHNCTDSEETDETTRQLFLNKEGSWFSGAATMEVENYHRTVLDQPVDPEDGKKGQTMWGAKFEDSPRFKQHLTWGQGRHERMLGFFDGYESDDDDFYWNRGGNRSREGREVNRFMVK